MSGRRARGTAAVSLVLVALGVAVIARTVALGVGGGLGLLLGGLMVLAGGLRMWLAGTWRRG